MQVAYWRRPTFVPYNKGDATADKEDASVDYLARGGVRGRVRTRGRPVGRAKLGELLLVPGGALHPAGQVYTYVPLTGS